LIVPLVVAGLMALALGGLAASRHVANGQIFVFGLSGESAQRRRVMLHGLSLSTLALGVVLIVVGLVVIVSS
jgi:hypothetical protein